MERLYNNYDSYHIVCNGKYIIVSIEQHGNYVNGLISNDNSVILEPKYDSITPSIETDLDIFVTKINAKEGSLREISVFAIGQNNEKIELNIEKHSVKQYLDFEGFYRGLSWFRTTESTGLINCKGKIVLECKEYTLPSWYKSEKTFLPVTDYGKLKWRNITNCEGYQGPSALEILDLPILPYESELKPIISIGCKNFGVFNNLEDDLKLSNFNFLIGANNSGKSTIIKLLALTTLNISSYSLMSREFIFSADSPTYHELRNCTYESVHSYESSEDLEIRVSIGELNIHLKISNSTIEEIKIFSTLLRCCIIYKSNSIVLFDFVENSPIVKSEFKSIKRTEKNLFINIFDIVCEEVNCSTILSLDTYPDLRMLGKYIYDAVYSSQFVKIISADHFDGDQFVSTLIIDSEYYHDKQLLQFVRRWLKILEIGDEITYIGESVYIKKNGEEKLYELCSFGRGIRNFCSIIIQFVNDIINRKYNKQMSIIIVEEPEQNLHPKLQSQLAVLFQEIVVLYHKCLGVNVQLFIETHSEYLIRKLQTLVKNKKVSKDDVSIIYVDNPNPLKRNSVYDPQIRQINIDDRGRLSNTFGSGFFDEADNLADEILPFDYV